MSSSPCGVPKWYVPVGWNASVCNRFWRSGEEIHGYLILDSNHHTFKLKAKQYVNLSIHTFELMSVKTNFKLSKHKCNIYNYILLYVYHTCIATIQCVWSLNIIQRILVGRKNRYQDTPAAHHYQSMEALKHPRLAYLNLGTAEMNQVF